MCRLDAGMGLDALMRELGCWLGWTCRLDAGMGFDARMAGLGRAGLDARMAGFGRAGLDAQMAGLGCMDGMDGWAWMLAGHVGLTLA